jgi:hypothetical protein
MNFDPFPDEEAEQRQGVAGFGAATVYGWARVHVAVDRAIQQRSRGTVSMGRPY